MSDKYGPATPQFEVLLETIKKLTAKQRKDLVTARAAAAQDASRADDQELAWNATWDAASSLLSRNQIGETFTQEQYDLLTTPWRTVIGSLHPDDPDIQTTTKEETTQ